MGEEGRYLSPTGRKTLESGARDWWGQSSLQVAFAEDIDDLGSQIEALGK